MNSATPKERVLRVPRSDTDTESYVLVNVIPDGASALDLKLVATEGEYPFVGSYRSSISIVRQGRTTKLQSRNYQGRAEDWEITLSTILLGTRHEDNEVEALKGLEVASSISDDGQMMITFRKNIGGITQRLGIVILDKNEEQAIELFEWTGIATNAAQTAEDEVISLTAKYRTQQETIAKLSNQLEDLINAKEEHENTLLEKFRELLNSKKLKIRDQQRLLAGAKVDPAKAAEIRQARHSAGSREPAPSGSRKRKANSAIHGKQLDSDEDDDGFEKMKVDQDVAPDEHEEIGRQETPEKSDPDETDDGNDEDLDSAIPARPKQSGHGLTGKADTIAVREGDKMMTNTAPPPRRELPFTTKAAPAKDTQKKDIEGEEQANDGDETGGETDDDEL
ncbi:MAG: hypothetical protein M1827_002080 [Pycnora praestabilis]|nr:MAG: hypothetical protein M1827_002080 [Pycnora praestabilis]